MHHRMIRASKGGNLSGVRCEKLQSPYLVQDPWLSSSMRMDEWEFPRADSLGAVPVTWKTQMGASYEGYSKRGTCTRCQHSPLSASQLGGVGGLHTEADATTMWLSATTGRMMLQNRPPCLRFNCCGHISAPEIKKSISRMHDSLALDPWLINCPVARSWFQHYTSACIPTLFSLAQRGLVDDMYSVAHSALHRCATSCFGSQKLHPKPTSQRTVAMSVWTGPARHQLHRFRRVLKLVNVKCIMLAWQAKRMKRQHKVTWVAFSLSRKN